MKNTHILNLKQEVPLDIRIEVYKDAIKYLENVLKDGYDEYSVALCILLPCLLWKLNSFFSLTPDGYNWGTNQTVIAFPELKTWLPVNDSFTKEHKRLYRIQKRIDFLKETITELKLIKT